MTLRKCIGWVILSALAAAWYAGYAFALGWWQAAAVLSTAGIIAGLVIVGLNLISGP